MLDLLTDFILVKYGMLLPRINSSDRGVEVDTVDPDQTAPHEAVWSWSTDLLCYINLLYLFNVRYILIM